jgi:hypothetical protein
VPAVGGLPTGVRPPEGAVVSDLNAPSVLVELISLFRMASPAERRAFVAHVRRWATQEPKSAPRPPCRRHRHESPKAAGHTNATGE